MKKDAGTLGVLLAPTLAALLGLACASLTQLAAPFQTASPRLQAQGPGTLFATVEHAAVDALIYAHLQAQIARDTRMRGGAIYTAGEGYSYDEIVVAGPMLPNLISYTLEPRDVARFQVYPRVGNDDVNRIRERPSMADRRSARFVDPLKRPLYILHPSLVIRVYRGEVQELEDVANLRRPAMPQRVAGPYSPESTGAAISRSSRTGPYADSP